MAALRVLGVDPGLTRCGVGVVDIAADRGATLVHVSVIRTDPATPLEQRVLAIAEGVAALLDEHAPHVVALERVFAQNNVRTVMGTAQASGVVLSAAAARGLAVALHTPSEVKAAVTGHGGADKKQVTAMVQRILRLDAPPTPADAADALALAICHGWRRGAVAPAGAEGSDRLTPAQRAWRAAEKSAAAPRVER
ncbi:crossover junction endodeoxyribonuclease RuvC [Microcella daejeonensis]|uniref:Crossover junction endodeoxyribonuclease RuvC n=1 Tax=Microcella daejeonensis TaxID=2994971 RepID=A0A9E8S969_9MICO|nr:crossover junction endodeoxyribonuclease RuvC [Microcella daejeonensis]WAB81171.1 crossover junction endodeoxyribonuclease RuvC [Microcella daejeonensis]WAB83337.1 crossover junction endodeoxyribonuclease RuvC [Microcella daejeonensis]